MGWLLSKQYMAVIWTVYLQNASLRQLPTQNALFSVEVGMEASLYYGQTFPPRLSEPGNLHSLMNHALTL